MDIKTAKKLLNNLLACKDDLKGLIHNLRRAIAIDAAWPGVFSKGLVRCHLYGYDNDLRAGLYVTLAGGEIEEKILIVSEFPPELVDFFLYHDISLRYAQKKALKKVLLNINKANRSDLLKIKKQLRQDNKEDSLRLFNAAWRSILEFSRGSEIDDLQGLYNQIVSEKINNPKSSFYIYGK